MSGCNEEKIPYVELYSSLVALRNTELSVYWKRYNILSALNFGLIAVALSAESNSVLMTHRAVVSSGGFLIAFIWLIITWKGKVLIEDRWDENIKIYEEECIDNINLRLFTRVVNKENKKKCIHKHLDNLNVPARSLPIICMLSWIAFCFI